MKKVLLGTTSLIILFGVFLYSYIKSLDPGELRRMLLHEVEKRIQGQCALEELEIGGLGTIYAKGLRVSTLKGQRVFEIGQLSLKLSLSDLIYSNLRFTSLDIKALKIFAEKNGDQWNFQNLSFTRASPSTNPRRLSIVSKSTNAKPFQIDSFWAEDAQFFVQGQKTFNFKFDGKVVDRKINVQNLIIEGPGIAKFQSSAFYDWSSGITELQIDRCEVEAGVVLDVYKQLSPPGTKVQKIAGLVAIGGDLRLTDAKITPNLKIKSDHILIDDSKKISNLEGYWNGSQIQSLMNFDIFTAKGRSKWTVRPLNGYWLWPNEYSVDLAADKVVTQALENQEFKGQLSMIISTDIVEVRKMSLSTPRDEGDLSLLEVDGGFSLKTKSGQLRIASRDLPVALFMPEHNGVAHWQAQLMLTQHFGLDYEIHGKVQKHRHDSFELGNADFHIAGQIDHENFEFSKFSVDIARNGSVNGSGLFRFTDPIGSLRSVVFLDSMHVNPIIRNPRVFAETKIPKGKIEFRNGAVSFRSSGVSVAGGELNVNLSSDFNRDIYKMLSNMKGKLNFEKLLISELNPSMNLDLPESTLQLSGYIVPQADFALNLTSLKSGLTNIKLFGTSVVNEKFLLPELRLSGLFDLDDLINNPIIDRYKLRSKLNLVGRLNAKNFDLEVGSKLFNFQISDSKSPVSISNLESFSYIDTDGNFGSRKTNFDLFDGRVESTFTGNTSSIESVQANARLKGININQLVAAFAPSMKGHFDGKLNAKINVIEHTKNPVHFYPLKVAGTFNVLSPKYTYHKTIVEALGSLKKSLKNGFLRKVATQEQESWKDATNKTSEFLDTTPQVFHFENTRLQIQSLELIEQQRRFTLKTSKPIFLDLPDEFRASGYCSTELELLATSQILKQKFPLLKDSYEEDLELVVKMEGPLTAPISTSQIDILKQKIIQRIGRNIDPKKVELAAKKAAKRAATRLKNKLKKKSKSLINEVLKLSTSDEKKSESNSSQPTETSAVVDIKQKKSEKVKQQVKKKLRSFLQDLF